VEVEVEVARRRLDGIVGGFERVVEVQISEVSERGARREEVACCWILGGPEAI
jgi:hypothetical protein